MSDVVGVRAKLFMDDDADIGWFEVRAEGGIGADIVAVESAFPTTEVEML